MLLARWTAGFSLVAWAVELMKFSMIGRLVLWVTWQKFDPYIVWSDWAFLGAMIRKRCLLPICVMMLEINWLGRV